MISGTAANAADFFSLRPEAFPFRGRPRREHAKKPTDGLVVQTAPPPKPPDQAPFPPTDSEGTRKERKLPGPFRISSPAPSLFSAAGNLFQKKICYSKACRRNSGHSPGIKKPEKRLMFCAFLPAFPDEFRHQPKSVLFGHKKNHTVSRVLSTKQRKKMPVENNRPPFGESVQKVHLFDTRGGTP